MGKPFSASDRICDEVAGDSALIRRLVASYPALASDGKAGSPRGRGWSLTFAEAAQVAGTEVAPLLAVANSDSSHSEQFGRLWFEDGCPHLDVRGLEPPQPLVSVMRLLDGPEVADSLIVQLDREPIYLFPQLDEHGWTHEIELRDEGKVRIAIRRAKP